MSICECGNHHKISTVNNLLWDVCLAMNLCTKATSAPPQNNSTRTVLCPNVKMHRLAHDISKPFPLEQCVCTKPDYQEHSLVRAVIKGCSNIIWEECNLPWEDTIPGRSLRVKVCGWPSWSHATAVFYSGIQYAADQSCWLGLLKFDVSLRLRRKTGSTHEGQIWFVPRLG